jgi:hypothetical protein
MALFKKKGDPISERAHALNDEIAALESEIKRLGSKLQQRQSQPRLRSTAVPHGATVTHGRSLSAVEPAASATASEPVFEDIGGKLLEGHAETSATPEHFNEKGVRKYDLPALLRRIRNLFHGPTSANPRLVSYLAAGGVQGLRPMRYEKRVARNRFFALTAIVFLLLTGIVWWYFRNR